MAKRKPARRKIRQYNAPLKANGKKDMGPVEKPIDLNKVRQLSRFLYTDRELAVCCDMSYSSFKAKKSENYKVQDAIDEGRAMCTASVRAFRLKQIMGADGTGNPQCSDRLLIHFANNHFGESDKVTHSNDPDHPMPPAVQQTFKAPENAQEAMLTLDEMLKNFKG